MALKDYYNDPFGFVDNLDLTFKGNQFNIFLKHKRLRRTAFVLAMVSLGAWIVFGFDSTPLQFIHVLYEGVPAFLTGQANLADLTALYHTYYGKEMHYSAFVIYGLMYWMLSRHLDRNLGITKSKNITYAASLTLFCIAVFEFYWIYSFAHFQNQPWVGTWRLPQLRILLQNLIFLTVGFMGALYMWADSYDLTTRQRLFRFNWNWKAGVLIGLSVATALVWWNYPWQVERFSVTLDSGEVWSNNQQFPQTLYTVDLNPLDDVNAGVWFWKENDLVHGWNTLVKILWTLSFLYVGKVKRVKPS